MLTHRDEQIIDWVGRIGAVSAADVAHRFAVAQRIAYARLAACSAAGLIEQRRLLHGQPGLYVATTAGLRFAGLERLGRCRISASSFAHAQACARVAAALERAHPGRVMGDRELRVAEREAGTAIASAELGLRPDGEPGSHHPDLALWPQGGGRPTAVEVEIAVKAPRRLQAICRSWARCRVVEEVAYFASAPAQRALHRAIAAMHAEEVIAVFALDAAPTYDPPQDVSTPA